VVQLTRFERVHEIHKPNIARRAVEGNRDKPSRH
jgi:hypothetical protein